jgi:sugar/nucleoside kinase (ribokinase family)
MRAVVVYESMYGNTHLVADAIGAGLGGEPDVTVTSVDDVDPSLVEQADLLVVGGPTHVHGMSRDATRTAAVEAAAKDDDLSLDPDAEGPGLRDWLDALPKLRVQVAAFDTRLDAPPLLTGRASKGITRRLHALGCSILADPESFLVTKQNHLEDDQEARARDWGRSLATKLAAVTK